MLCRPKAKESSERSGLWVKEEVRLHLGCASGGGVGPRRREEAVDDFEMSDVERGIRSLDGLPIIEAERERISPPKEARLPASDSTSPIT